MGPHQQVAPSPLELHLEAIPDGRRSPSPGSSSWTMSPPSLRAARTVQDRPSADRSRRRDRPAGRPRRGRTRSDQGRRGWPRCRRRAGWRRRSPRPGGVAVPIADRVGHLSPRRLADRRPAGASGRTGRSALLDHHRAGHVRVDRATEGVGARGQRRHVVGRLGRPGDDCALEHGIAGGILDPDVVRNAGVLVVEQDRERLAGRSVDGRLLEVNVQGADRDRRSAAGTRRCAARPRRSEPAAARWTAARRSGARRLARPTRWRPDRRSARPKGPE